MEKKIFIVASRYRADIMDGLLAGAQQALAEAGIQENETSIVRVPGSFEIPQACDWIIRSQNPAAIVALGAIQKGETIHDEVIAHAVARALQDLMRDDNVPIGFGVMTFITDEQGLARSGNQENRGYEAAKAALEMLEVKQQL